jgi:hypothetical protein
MGIKNNKYSTNTNSSGFRLNSFQELTQITTKEDVALGIMRWGEENFYPQTLKNIVEQSPSAKPAVDRVAKFYKGGSFEGEDIIVNSYGLTLRNIVDKAAEDLAFFDAFAIQSNFNVLGEPNDMNPMRIESLRFNQFDELSYASKIGYHRNFGQNDKVEMNTKEHANKDNIKFINVWNPKFAKDQFDSLENGLNDYNGQVLYYSGAGPSSYPIPPLQSVINFVLSDVENSILVRKETATGFVSSYILKSSLDYDDANLIAMENSIAQMQGARGAGKIMTISGLSEEEMKSSLLEEIGAGNSSAIIDSATKTFDLDKKVITGVYLIPPVLSGIEVSTGFSTEALVDAYNVFNAITKQGRKTIEREVNKILKAGSFGIDSIELTSITLDVEGGASEESEPLEAEESMVADNTTLTNLSGRQLQGIQRIVRKYNKGELTEGQASQLLKQGFGFDDNAVDEWLISPEEEAEENAKEGEPNKIKDDE